MRVFFFFLDWRKLIWMSGVTRKDDTENGIIRKKLEKATYENEMTLQWYSPVHHRIGNQWYKTLSFAANY